MIFNNINNNSVHNVQNIVTIHTESVDMLTLSNQTATSTTVISNKQRHNDISLIILSISLTSVILYLPIM
ncbi:unnamed protein product, partial [Rotaria socialis]